MKILHDEKDQLVSNPVLSLLNDLSREGLPSKLCEQLTSATERAVSERDAHQRQINLLKEQQDAWEPAALVVAHDLSWYRPPHGERVSLKRRRVLRKTRFENFVAI